MARSAAHAVRGEPAGRRALRAAPTVLLYLLGALAVWFVWPASLGGCTTLTIVSGHSMEPTLTTGDLVVARCGQAKVGDIVVYAPPGMDRTRVIHRVVGGDGAGGWTLQGDNNAWEDPFAPTDDRVVGIARLRVPGIGAAATVLVNPWLWFSVLILAAALLVWPTRSRDDVAGAQVAPAAEVPVVEAAVPAAGTDTPARAPDAVLAP